MTPLAPWRRYNPGMTTNGQYYSDTGREFIARARTYLAEDDLLQASEKGWGAAAQMVQGRCGVVAAGATRAIATCMGRSTAWSPRPVTTASG